MPVDTLLISPYSGFGKKEVLVRLGKEFAWHWLHGNTNDTIAVWGRFLTGLTVSILEMHERVDGTFCSLNLYDRTRL